MQTSTLTGIDHSDAQRRCFENPQILPDQPEPPRPLTLQVLAQSTTGRILGSNTTKVIGGLLIGVGIAFSWTGFGIGLVAAGAVIWLTSTAASTAGLEQPTPIQVASHLGTAVFFGITGIFGGILNFGGVGAASLASLSPHLINVGAGLQYFSLVAPALDFHSSTKIKPNPVPQLNVPNISDLLQQIGIKRLHEHNFNSSEEFNNFALLTGWGHPAGDKPQDSHNPPQLEAGPEQTNLTPIRKIDDQITAILQKTKSDGTVLCTTSEGPIILDMHRWQDYQTPLASADRSCEWVAVPLSYVPMKYQLMEKSTYDLLMTDTTTGQRLLAREHPETGAVMADIATVQGTELITWLDEILQQISGTT